MSEPITTSEANHYVWGEVCDGWHLVRNAELSVIEERMPPGTAEQRHFHRRARQFFYVLAGAFAMEMEGRIHHLAAGQGIEIPPGAPHQARNDSAADVRFLVVSSPPSHGDREAAPAAGPDAPARTA